MKPEPQNDSAENKANQPVTPEETPKTTKESSKKGLDYVFKIAPVDPKSSGDFEDVADK